MNTLPILLEETHATLVAHAPLNLENGHLNGLDEEHKKTRWTPRSLKPTNVAVLLQWPLELAVNDFKTLTCPTVPPPIVIRHVLTTKP